jgi:cytidylate kinase
MPFPSTIAIDGPAASGKSTLGKRLADDLGYLYFDTGVMYRAVTWAALQRGLALQDEAAISQLAASAQIDVRSPSQADGRSADVLVDGVDITWDIRRPEVDANVSLVSSYAAVRQALTEQQRRIGQRGSVVMVGRDIGTVVLPEADLKIYLDASVEERARRRFAEQQEQQRRLSPSAPPGPSYAEILEAMRRRDLFDSTRSLAPLRPAGDAVIVNSDGLDADQSLARVKSYVFQYIQEPK